MVEIMSRVDHNARNSPQISPKKAPHEAYSKGCASKISSKLRTSGKGNYSMWPKE